MGTFGAILAAISTLAEQNTIAAISQSEIRPKYHQTEYESACGSTVLRIRFRNSMRERGRIEHLLIDGRPAQNVAATLDVRAARRSIVSFEIMDCGLDRHRPVFHGAMVLSEAESRAAGMRHMLFFRLTRQGKDWSITVD
jgi:hypothetical protein